MHKKSSYVRLIPGSSREDLKISDVIELLQEYQEVLSLAGQQLNWDYKSAALPYEITIHNKENQQSYLILKGRDTLMYNQLIIGVCSKSEHSSAFIQIVIGESSTQGDLCKANELAKFLAKQLKAELQLFNDRTICFK